MENMILNLLKNYKKKKIFLIDIENALCGNIEYMDFANNMKELEDMGILIPIKSHGTNNKKIPLANTYRINRSYFRQDLIDEIASYQLKSNKNINLQAYFSLSDEMWQEDLPYIKMVESYLQSKGLPKEEVTSSERSYEVTGDEKWIDVASRKRIGNS